MKIYYESQRGNMCRLHSINGYFGQTVLNDAEFFRHCDDYDKIIEGLHSRNMDGFAEGRSIVSYIIDKLDRKFVLLIPINSYKGAREHLDLDRYLKMIPLLNNYFEFNKDHVWIIKQIENKWYKIDSLSGVHEINQLNKFHKRHGYLLVIDDKLLYKELEYYIQYLKKIEHDDLFNNTHEIVFYNLYHSLKHIETNIKKISSLGLDDPKFIEKMVVINNIKNTLHEFMECRRYSFEQKTYQKILTKIYNLVKMID